MSRTATNGILVLAGSLITAGAAHAQIIISPGDAYPAASQPSGLAAGDFDGDGDRDFATTAGGPDRIVTLLNDGNGNFAAGPAAGMGASTSPQDIKAADLDGDTDLDLAVAVRDPVGAVVIFLNNGAGGFTMSGTFAVGDRPRGLDIADIDGDNDMDISVANRDGNSASLLTNNGSASFTVQTVPVGGEARATVLVDLDGDNDGDLAVTNADGRSVVTFANVGGVLVASTVYSVGPLVRPDGIDAADLDGDGDQDLAVAVSDQTLGINQVAVFVNPGGGGALVGPTGYDTGGTNTSGVIIADLDCDGTLDLITSNQDSSDVSLLRGTGGATYGAPSTMPAGTTPQELATADIDGDGDTDFATAARDSNSVVVFTNLSCAPVIPGDITGPGGAPDGVVDALDFLLLIAQWGSPCTGPCEADITGPGDVPDGNVDALDFLLLLANWS